MGEYTRFVRLDISDARDVNVDVIVVAMAHVSGHHIPLGGGHHIPPAPQPVVGVLAADPHIRFSRPSELFSEPRGAIWIS